MQRNILKTALICSIALLLAALPAPSLNAAQTTADTDTQNTGTSQQRETYYVNAQNGLKMRSSPSKDSDVITLLPYGAEVAVIGTPQSGWCEIEYSGEKGYVAEKYITKSDEDDADLSIDTSDLDESIPSTELSPEGLPTSTLGVTPVIMALIAAIIIMILLAIFTAYSFLKKESRIHDEEYYDDNTAEEYDEEDYDYDEPTAGKSNGKEYYNDEEYYDEEYYDEEYYDEDE